MATYKTIGIWPPWVPNDTGEPKVHVTPKAVHKIYYQVKTWHIELSLDWTITDGGSYNNTASGSVSTDFGAIGTVGDEYDIIRPPGFTGFGIGPSYPITIGDEWHYSGGTDNGAGLDNLAVTIGTAASAFALNPSRASYTSDEEFDVVAYVRFKNPNPFYDFDVVGEPDDVGTTLEEILIALPFESAIAGDPFFCEATQSDTVAQDGFSLHYDIHVKCTPSEYWSWDGRIDTSTGEPI